MKLLAVDLGGTHISCAAVEDRLLLERVRLDCDSSRNMSTYLSVITEILSGFVDRHGTEFSGVSFGFCGLVDGSSARISSTNRKYPGSTEIDLPAWARQKFSLPLLLENDSRLALLGEWHCGAAEHHDDVVMMTLGTGIGTAAIINGQILRGRHSQAGILGGHFVVDLEGHDCSCGARGCAEAEASTFALRTLCIAWPGFDKSALQREEQIDFETLFLCAKDGDLIAQQIRRRCLDVWSATALSLVHAYDPELVVLGGGVMKSEFPILESIRSCLERRAWTPWGKVRVSAAILGSDAALYGGVPLFQESR